MLNTNDLIRLASALSDVGFVDWVKFIALIGLYGSIIRYIAATVADSSHVVAAS
jgi:hypothetical protein